MPDRYLCLADNCQKQVSKTKNDRYRSHTNAAGDPCPNSSEQIPLGQLELGPISPKADPGVPEEGRDYATCECGRKVKLTRLGYFEPHDKTLRGGDRCEKSGTRFRPHRPALDEETPASAPSADSGASTDFSSPASSTSSLPEPPILDGHLPGEVLTERAAATPPASAEDPTVSATTSRFLQPTAPSPESTDTPSGSELPETGPFSLGVSYSNLLLQPFSPFIQPPEYVGPEKAAPMTALAQELATKIKETFYAYSNRKTSDNRSAQTTLGPSEIGTPCDRRLAMALMGVPAVNPGGDGWAAFVGTRTHAGMAEVYTFADAGTGRYAVELPVFLGVPTVPRGTTDLLDRRDATVVDWKVMGKYSLDKFKKEGPSVTYRTQVHGYGLGAERAGEKVKNVAVVGLPRAGSSLDEMHVWTEPYDRRFAQAALDRVERIADQLQEIRRPDWLGETLSEMSTAKVFEPADDCRYCPFHLKGDTEMRRGCPGR